MTVFRVHAIDEAALAAFGGELAPILATDDRAGLAKLCGSEDAVASWPRRLVEVYLVAPTHGPSHALRSAISAAVRARCATDAIVLESRVVDDLVRNVASDAPDRAGALLLRLLDEARVPVFLRDPQKTAGMISRAERVALVSAMAAIDLGALDELLDALRRIEPAAMLERG